MARGGWEGGFFNKKKLVPATPYMEPPKSFSRWFPEIFFEIVGEIFLPFPIVRIRMYDECTWHEKV